MKDLVKHSGIFIEEMQLIYQKAEKSRVYRLLYHHLPALK